MNDQIHFSVSIDKKEKDHFIDLYYKVENRSDTGIYLTNHGVRMDPDKGQVPDKNAVWIYLLDDKKIVHITKRRPPVSQKMMQPRLHFVTPLKPGESYDEEIKIPTPLLQNDPDSLTPPQGSKEVKTFFNHVYFSLEYLIGNSTVQALESEYQGEKVFSISPQFDGDGKPLPMTQMKSQMLSSGEFNLKIPVILWK